MVFDGNVCGLGSVKHREFAFASGEMSRTQFTGFLEETLGNIGRVMRDGARRQSGLFYLDRAGGSGSRRGINCPVIDRAFHPVKISFRIVGHVDVEAKVVGFSSTRGGEQAETGDIGVTPRREETQSGSQQFLFGIQYVKNRAVARGIFRSYAH